MLKIPEKDTKFLCFNYVKIYPNQIKIYQFHKPFYKKISDDFEPEDNFIELNYQSKRTITQQEMSALRSINRTKTVISDLVLCNEFNLFATFTFKSNRQDIIKCKQRMINWLKSQQKMHGKFQYLIVPEYHKDKKSLHFHALFKDYTGSLVDSGILINGRKVYNFTGYQNGFNSGVKIDNINKVSSYVKKYITKELVKHFAKKRYWSSKTLQRPHLEYNWELLEEQQTYKTLEWENEYFTLYVLPYTLKPTNHNSGG
jgi:hypothetical protein